MAMRKTRLWIPFLAVLLSACVTFSSPRGDRTVVEYMFDDPTPADVRLERAGCIRSPLCNWYVAHVVGWGPAALDAMLSGDSSRPVNCQTHTDRAAAVAVEIQQDVPSAGVGPSCKLSGTVASTARCPADAIEPDGRCRHAVLGVYFHGEPMVIDNGALRGCNRICGASQLKGFEPRVDRSTGSACPEFVTILAGRSPTN